MVLLTEWVASLLQGYPQQYDCWSVYGKQHDGRDQVRTTNHQNENFNGSGGEQGGNILNTIVNMGTLKFEEGYTC